jgi:hypothetical protein
MTRDHRVIEELLAVDALAGLDDEDRNALERELAGHGPGCPECRDLQAGFAETAAMLGLSLEPEPVDPSLADRILTTPWAPEIGPHGRVSPRPARKTRSRGRRVVASLIGIAASIALIATGVAILRPADQGIDRLATSQRFVAFQGDRGELAMAYTPDAPGVVVVGSQLPDPPSGHAYELWTFRGDTPVSAGCLVPTDGHVGRALPQVIPTATMAVTVEPATCPAAPTGDVIFTASVA